MNGKEVKEAMRKKLIIPAAGITATSGGDRKQLEGHE
jgi:hypothetical protein